MWKLHPEAEGYSREQNLVRAKRRLQVMKDLCPQIRSMEIGINICNAAHAYDLVMTTEFNSLEELQIYQVSPVHKDLISFLSNLRSERHVVDYYLE